MAQMWCSHTFLLYNQLRSSFFSDMKELWLCDHLQSTMVELESVQR